MDTSTLHVACVQLTGTTDVAANLERAGRGIAQAAARGARLIVLPEKWNLIGEPHDLQAGAEPIDGPAMTQVRQWAQQHDAWILAGSMAERIADDDLLRNASCLVDPAGQIVARYCKSHMFDVEVGGVTYRESASERAGDELVVSAVDGVPIGLSICYDLRFPELYRALAVAGARILAVPAAFTVPTGHAHWEVLLRARAIENQCFVVAADMMGDHGGGKLSYGRSMIIDPWGTVLATAPDAGMAGVPDVQVIDVILDLSAIDRVRTMLPVMTHRRPELYDRAPSITHGEAGIGSAASS